MSSYSKPAVAFIGAHPDDIVGAAGTLLLLKENFQVHDMCMTRGQRGYAAADPRRTPPSDELASRRTAEEEAVCKMLDAKLTWFEEMDGDIFASRETCEKVAAALAEIKPMAVFTHSPLEKPDHAATSLVTQMALNMAELYWTTELYMPVFLGEHHALPRPDVFVNIGSVIDQKREITKCYESQWVGVVDLVMDQSKVYGRMAWCDYAEAFLSGLPLMGVRWNRKAGSILMDLEA